MTFEHYTKPKYKKISQAKKRKLWNSIPCSDCGKDTENPITSYTWKGITIVNDEKICSSCLEDRIDSMKQTLRMIKSGELEV